MSMRKNVCLSQRLGELFGGYDQRVRIAVVGAQESGKTIFLVSLINHLMKADFGDLGKWGLSFGTQILTPRCEPPIKPFDYNRYRGIYDALFGNKDGRTHDKGSVPPSTLEPYMLQLMVPLGRTDNGIVRKRKVLVEVLDVPGERVADFAMFRRSYKDWCREIKKSHEMVAGGFSAFDQYMTQAAKATSADEIMELFFGFVLNQYNNNSSLIYPSGILLDSSGYRIDNLNKGSHPFFKNEVFFAPLPEAFFNDKTKRGIVKSFDRAYKKYCSESGLNDVCGWLETANKAYYLLDVFSILMSGKERENDMRGHIVETLKVFGAKERNMIGRLYNGAVDFLVRSRAEEIYLVGTQIDRASKNQRDNIKKLLENEFGSVLRMPALAGKFCGIMTCAAMRFGQDDGVEQIEMSYKRSPHEADIFETKKFSNKVPEKFPADYAYVDNNADPRQKDYAYPYSQPRFCGDEKKVYDHLAFDEIVKTIFATSAVKGGVK